jgi:mono/diheme cytochrome c family protein
MPARPLCLASILLAVSIVLAKAQDGLYTAEQAKRGEAAYDANCATCHGGDLRSSDREVPNLSDRWFRSGWVGKTVAEKFKAIRETMPPKEPGSLGDQVYLDILAYILQFNRIPAGNHALTADLPALKQLVVPTPPSP